MSAALQKDLSKDFFENRLPQVLESLNKTLKSRGGKYFAANKVKNLPMAACIIIQLNKEINSVLYIVMKFIFCCNNLGGFVVTRLIKIITKLFRVDNDISYVSYIFHS